MEWGSNLNQCDINYKLQLYLHYSLSYLQKRTTKKYEVRLIFNALMKSQNDTPHAIPLHTTLPYSECLIQVPNIHASRGVEHCPLPNMGAIESYRMIIR
jgi:hypothetical protein